MSLPPDPEGCGAGAFIYRDTSARGLYAGLAPHFNDRRLSDICILRPDGKTVYAHQVVLAACSRKFSSVFGQGEATGKELPIQGVDSAALELVISSFYHGECRLTPTTVVPVYDVCLKLEVPGLTTACEQYLQRSMSADTCCIYLEAALGVLLEHTVKSCLTYAKGRFEEVAASPSFLSLSTKTVRLLLTQVRNSGSGITDISLARALARWAVTKPEHLSECESIFKELNVTTTALLQLLQSAEFVHALQSKPGVAAAGGAGVGGVGGGGSVAGAGNQQQQHPLPSPHHQQPPQAAAAAAGDATPASQQQQQGGAGPWRDGRETFGSVREASSREGGAVSSGLPALGGIGNGRTGGPNGSPAQNASSQQAPGGPAGATAGPPHGGPPQQPRSSPLLASSGAGKTGERGPHGDYGGDGPGARPASAAGAQYGTGSGGSGRGPSSQQAAPQQGSRPGSGRSPPPPFGRQSQPEHLAGAGGSSGLAVGGSDGPFQRRSLPPELLSGTADDDRQQAYARRYGTIAGGSPALRSLLGPGRGGGNDRAAPDSEIAAAAARGAGGGGGDGGGERDNLVALPLPMLELAGLTVQLTPSGTLAATGGPLGSKQVPLSVSSGSGRSGPLMVLLPAGVVRRLQQASSGPVAFESGGGGGSGRSGAVGSGGRPDDGSPPLPPGLLQPQQQHQQRDPGTDRPDRYGGPGVSPHAAAPLGRGSAGLGPFQRSSLDMLSSVAASAEEQAGFVDVPGLPRIGPAGARPASASGLAAGPRSASLGAGALGLSGGRSGRQVDLGGLGSLAQHMVSDSGGVPGRWSVPGIGPGAGGSTLLSLGGSLSGPGDLLSADAGSLNGGGGPLLGGISKRRRPSPEDFDPDHEEPGLGLGGAGGGGGRGGGGGLTPPAAGGGGGGRGRGGGGYSSKGPLLCHVDDCNVDLSSLKEYHQRFRICDFHLKAEVVLREGIPQRFCQQCGRFHLLSEFDGTKRSCRARLQRHNARRRKRPDQKGDGDDVPRRRPVYQTMPQHVSAGVVAGNMALAAAAAAAGMPGPHAGGGGGAGSSSMHIPGLPSLSTGPGSAGLNMQLPLDIQHLLAQQHQLRGGGVVSAPGGWAGAGVGDDMDGGDGEYDADDNGGPSGDDTPMDGTPADAEYRYQQQQQQQQREQQAVPTRGGGGGAAGVSGIRSSQIIRDILAQAEERQQREQQQSQQQHQAVEQQGQGQHASQPSGASAGVRASLLDLAMAIRAHEGEVARSGTAGATGGTAAGGSAAVVKPDTDHMAQPQQQSAASVAWGADGRPGPAAAAAGAGTDAAPAEAAGAGGAGDGSPLRSQQPAHQPPQALPPPQQAPSPPPVKVKLEPGTSVDAAAGGPPHLPGDAAATSTCAGTDARAAAEGRP